MFLKVCHLFSHGHCLHIINNTSLFYTKHSISFVTVYLFLLSVSVFVDHKKGTFTLNKINMNEWNTIFLHCTMNSILLLALKVVIIVIRILKEKSIKIYIFLSDWTFSNDNNISFDWCLKLFMLLERERERVKNTTKFLRLPPCKTIC